MFKRLFTFLTVVLFTSVAFAQTDNNLFFVFLNSNPGQEALHIENAKAIQTAHLENIDKLTKEGKLFAAGTFEDGGSMFILHAESLEEAQGFLQTDPAIQSNYFITEVFPFQLAHGRMCGAKEPYKMATYQLIRFTNMAKDSEPGHQVTYDTRIFMGKISTDNKGMVAQGYINNQADGVLILDAKTPDDARRIFKKHPSVRSHKMTYDIKTLSIAEGTFCE
jgi:uncharacterized protein YciI